MRIVRITVSSVRVVGGYCNNKSTDKKLLPVYGRHA
jgi:hypothetical protein